MTQPNSPTAADVRAWAVDQGLSVGTRGRLSAEVVEAYNKANPRKKYAPPAPASA